MKARLLKYRYLLLFLGLCLLLLLLALVFSSDHWLMGEGEILDYYRETYGQEMKILSRNVEEYREGDTHTRSQSVMLCPADLPELEFEYFQWAGYAYSPGPIPQLFPSFSTSMRDDYPKEALIYALQQFASGRGLGTVEKTGDGPEITLRTPDWEGAVRELAGYSNSLRDTSPYNHLEYVFLLTFRRVLDSQPDAVFRADLLSEGCLDADPEEIIQSIRIAGNRARAAQEFCEDLQAFLAESGLSYRTESGYNEWVFCQRLDVSIDVGSLRELDAVLTKLAAFAEPLRTREAYTAEGLQRVPIAVHFVQTGVPEPKGQIGTWTPFGPEGLSIEPAAIRERIVKLDLLPDEASPSQDAPDPAESVPIFDTPSEAEGKESV